MIKKISLKLLIKIYKLHAVSHDFSISCDLSYLKKFDYYKIKTFFNYNKW